jgi:hypothetical protein
MPQKPCTFRKNDLVRALKAAQEAGMSLARVEIETDGRIVMIVGLAAAAIGIVTRDPNDDPFINDYD